MIFAIIDSGKFKLYISTELIFNYNRVIRPSIYKFVGWNYALYLKQNSGGYYLNYLLKRPQNKIDLLVLSAHSNNLFFNA